MTIMFFLSLANFAISLSIVADRLGILEPSIRAARRRWSFFIMDVALLFRKKIVVRPYLEYYSSHQATDWFYLLRIYKCSHERHFKLISGSYTTIVPERGIMEIDGKPFKTKS